MSAEVVRLSHSHDGTRVFETLGTYLPNAAIIDTVRYFTRKATLGYLTLRPSPPPEYSLPSPLVSSIYLTLLYLKSQPRLVQSPIIHHEPPVSNLVRSTGHSLQ